MYKNLNQNKVGDWIRNLSEHKGSPDQIQFLEIALNNQHQEFVDYIEESIGPPAYEPDGEVPSLLGVNGEPVLSLTPGHMYKMPANDIVTLYRHWESLSYQEAAQWVLWGAITLSEIRAERIAPLWLANMGEADEGMASMKIMAAIRKRKPKTIDTWVRRILRWMLGSGHFRGAPELYGNCSLAKAWWCGYLAHQYAEQFRLTDEREIVSVAGSLKEMWLGMADYLAGRLTVISEPNVTNGLTMWGKHYLLTEQNSKLRRKDVEVACRKLGELSVGSVLGIQSPATIKELICEYHPMYKEDTN